MKSFSLPTVLSLQNNYRQTTPFLGVLLFSTVLLIVMWQSVAAQTVTNVSPTRVTNGTIVTITGTGFTSVPTVTASSISINEIRRINSETVTFRINRSNARSNSDPFGTDSNDVFNSTLVVAGVSTSFQLDYIAPTIRNHSSSGTNTVERITEIYTNLNGFWRSDPPDGSTPPRPNNKHELLGFKYDGVIYSTGVDDALLEANLLPEEIDNVPSLEYLPQNFKAYSTNGVDSNTNSSHYIATGDLVDGIVGEGTTITSPEILGMTVYQSLIDGVNGLELGTGITNLNRNATVRFFSGNGQVGALGNNVPDLVITQIAAAGGTDIYYYADIDGNVVGRPVRITISNSNSANPPIAIWQLDLYRFTNGISFDVATPISRSFGSNETRPLRMLSFRLEEFGISATNIADINNINIGAGGTADMAFVAYNRAAFAIKSPVIIDRPSSRFICELPSSDIINFESTISIDGEAPDFVPTDPREILSYQWYQYNSEIDGSDPTITGETSSDLTINGVNSSKIGKYRLVASNDYGAIILPVFLNEGGVPTTWNGTTWTPLATGSGVGGTVLDKERSLIFNADYALAGDLEGCDCTVTAGNDVLIPSGSSLKLFGKLTVEDEILEVIDPDNGNILVEAAPAGTFYLEDGASLVQINDVSSNENTGIIEMDRRATGMNDNDFIYWSSPVAAFDIDNLPNSGSYLWDPRAPNTTATDGNWVAFNGSMDLGRGYIARVPFGGGTTNFEVLSKFTGVPNNGVINRPLIKSAFTPNIADRHWNLVGNPYPSAIDANKFLTQNSTIEGSVYIWDSNSSTFNNTNPAPFYENSIVNYSDAYITYNSMGSVPANAFDGNIAAGQGFFVKVLDAVPVGTAQFRNTMRYGAGETLIPNDDFLRNAQSTNEASETAEKQLLWLFLSNEANQSSTTLVGYATEATNGKDRLYDAFANKGEGELSLHSVLENNNMVIQGRALPFDTDDMVSMGVQIPEVGVYQIGIDKLEGTHLTDPNLSILLEDTYLYIIQDLKVAPYTFTADVTGTINDRFVLRYTANQLSVEEKEMLDDLKIYYASQRDKIVIMNSNGFQIESVEVFNMLGQSVQQSAIDRQQNYYELPFNNSQAGAYVLHVRTDRGIRTKKFIVSGFRD